MEENALRLGPVKRASSTESFDVLIRGGTVYDGTGKPPRRADVGIKGDRIAAVGDLAGATAKDRGGCQGPGGRPRVHQHAELVHRFPSGGWPRSERGPPGRHHADHGRGLVVGPRQPCHQEAHEGGADRHQVRDRMEHSERLLVFPAAQGGFPERGVVPRCDDRPRVRPRTGEQEADRPPNWNGCASLVDREMRDGALGIATALEYSPAYYADTEELIALCKVAARHKGKYITHMRSEGDRLLEGIDEAIRISREAKIPAEIYHFKAAGKNNWKKMDAAIARVEAARREGLAITANMYCYTAGAAPLTACIPPWAMEGGEIAMRHRLRDPDSRKRILDDIRHKTDWPNFYHNAGSPENILLISFKQEALKPLQGKSLAQIARQRGKDPVETLLDLLVEDQSSIGTAYFITAEENIRKLVPLPWVSFGCDEAAQAPEGVFLKSMPHPRAYGNFARVLGKYVREEKLLSSGKGDPQAHPSAGDELGARSPRPAARGLLRRRGRLRSEDHRRPGDLREAPSVRGRRSRCVRQRGAGAEGRRAHRRQTREGVVGAG